MSDDPKRELLRTQAVQALLTALHANEVHVYGTEPSQWAGTTLDSNSQITTSTHWQDSEGRWRYDVIVSVDVRKTQVGP